MVSSGWVRTVDAAAARVARARSFESKTDAAANLRPAVKGKKDRKKVTQKTKSNIQRKNCLNFTKLRAHQARKPLRRKKKKKKKEKKKKKKKQKKTKTKTWDEQLKLQELRQRCPCVNVQTKARKPADKHRSLHVLRFSMFNALLPQTATNITMSPRQCRQPWKLACFHM